MRCLVGQRKIDRKAGRGPLALRRDPGKAATGGLTQDVAKGGGQQGDAMLLLAPQSYDGSLAVALRLKRRQGGKREPGDQFTNGGAGGNELTEIVLIATDQRILYQDRKSTRLNSSH